MSDLAGSSKKSVEGAGSMDTKTKHDKKDFREII